MPIANSAELSPSLDDGTLFPTHAISISAVKDGLSITSYCLHERLWAAPTQIDFWTWLHDETIEQIGRSAENDGYGDQPIIAKMAAFHRMYISRFVAAGVSWLNQRVLSAINGAVPRQQRKSIARAHKVDVLDYVKVVELRRPEPRSHNGDGDSSPEWSHRWIVSGHWRNQWHPSTEKHELQYILPYVKGPEDKPLKVPKAEVFVVNR